jgi:hypothetical protein
LAWNGSGVRTSGKGLALTPQGLLGHNGTKTTFFIDAVTGNAVFDGTLDASAVTTGFINAARIQVGTATVSASGTSGSNMTFPLPGISTASVDGVSIGHTCTGSPVTVIATASSAVFSCDSNTSKVFFTHQLFVDGALASWVLENVQSTEYVNCIVWGTNREADSIGTIIFRFTPSLGTHSYQLKTTATLYNTSTGLTNFSVGSNLGFVNIRSQIIVTENKI